MRSVLTSFVALIVCVSPAAAQDVARDDRVLVDISLGGAVAKDVGADCSLSEGSTTISLSNCSPLGVGFGGGFAVHVTERVALVGGLSWAVAGLDTNATISDRFLGSANIPVEMSSNAVGFTGGVRLYFQQRAARVRGYADLGVGYATGTVEVSVLGFTASETTSGVGVGPGLGIEVMLSDAVLFRFGGGPSIAFTDDGASTSIGAGAAVVFRIGG